MLWTDLELEHDVTDDQLRDAWAKVFAVEPGAVVVVEDYPGSQVIADNDPWADPRVRILLERHQQSGEFPLHVMVILGDETLDQKVEGWDRELAMIQRLADELDARMLISDDDISPYSWILVTPHAAMTPVRVDADQLDDHDALVLAHPINGERHRRPRKIVAAR